MRNDKKTVLVADDDASVVEILRDMLEFSNYQVRTAAGDDVIPQVNEEKPDVVLMDISMPDADGRDVCRTLKKSRDTREVPVILISAGYNVDRSSRAAGADDFIAKPFDMYDLLRKVAKQANKHPWSAVLD